MNCQNHQATAAAATCAGCAEAFCENCLVPMGATRYCAGCKTMAVPPSALTITRESEEANKALKLSFLGLFCFGFIVAPMAISAALTARKEIAANPTVGGLGKANAALVIAPAVFIVSVVGAIIRFKGIGR